MAAWPLTLPQAPLLEGWSEDLADNAYRFQPRQGRAITRRKQSTRYDTQNVQFYFTAAQKGTFDNFYYDDCDGGALSFTFTHPVSGVVYDFQFTGRPPSHRRAGMGYITSCSIMRVS